MTFLRKIFSRYFEWAVWLGGLISLAVMNPGNDQHYSLCLFKWMGMSFCPGCGLGHSISWLFHGQFERSFHAHPLGLLAIVILVHRIYILSINLFSSSLINK